MTAITKPIEITEEIADNLFEDCGFNYEGIKYEFVKELDEDMDDNSKTYSYIVKEEGTNHHYNIDVCLARYGYEDYGFEKYLQNNKMYRVELKTVTTEEWVVVKEESND
ncbi:hypothetical protein [Bacillus wiedmannii]|uniref:hypothetical protein n=1 Tax=Bacillus wiedmannii TaxID=1890302 RepID=UPI000B43EC0F|nr:hypothetical protein BK740_25520 [Bacillus thuringiensis serovar argentinensis]